VARRPVEDKHEPAGCTSYRCGCADATAYAYERLPTPAAFMMLATYAVTAWLAGAGGSDRARAEPLLPLGMGAKTLYDLATTLMLGREE
jgi:hypothetical protein